MIFAIDGINHCQIIHDTIDFLSTWTAMAFTSHSRGQANCFSAGKRNQSKFSRIVNSGQILTARSFSFSNESSSHLVLPHRYSMVFSGQCHAAGRRSISRGLTAVQSFVHVMSRICSFKNWQAQSSQGSQDEDAGAAVQQGRREEFFSVTS